jgi:hypothetical protein
MKRNYKVVYEVWMIHKGDFDTHETYLTEFDTDRQARAFIIQERSRLWNLGGMRLALGTKYEIRTGRR